MGQEAMFLFKQHNVYYMACSKTMRYKPSNTYYRTANQLSRLWSNEARVTCTTESVPIANSFTTSSTLVATIGCSAVTPIR